MDYSKIIDYFKTSNCKFMINEKMSEHTTFRIGGNADIFVEISNINVLINSIRILKKQSIPYFLIGNGSNVLIDDSGYRGIIFNLKGEFENITLENNTIKCGSGARLSSVCKFALKNSLSGLEFAYGIPGSVGGAIFMNAGAYGSEMKDIISFVECIDKNGNLHKMSNNECKFDYRKSVFSSKEFVITSVEFILNNGKYNEIESKMKDLISRRRSKQPLEYPSAGSFFKRPKDHHASALIDQCGLKGLRIGDAAISSKHAGFIINLGHATSTDVNRLKNEIISRVLESTNVKLDTEVQFI